MNSEVCPDRNELIRVKEEIIQRVMAAISNEHAQENGGRELLNQPITQELDLEFGDIVLPSVSGDRWEIWNIEFGERRQITLYADSVGGPQKLPSGWTVPKGIFDIVSSTQNVSLVVMVPDDSLLFVCKPTLTLAKCNQISTPLGPYVFIPKDLWYVFLNR